MPVLEIADALLEYDPVATRRAYAQRPAGSPEECGCADCRNFAATRDVAYPAPVRAILEQLGVDPTREAEIWRYNREADGWHRYGGFFHIVGRVLRSGPPDEHPVTPDFGWLLQTGADLVPEPFLGHDLVQLQFITRVPWVLAEPDEP
ncbi:MAG TPA: hypothetical protein VF151_05890 [Gemmatimonadales bacterium]